MSSIKLILYTHKLYADDTHPIMLQYIENRKIKRKVIHKCKLKDWYPKTERLKPKSDSIYDELTGYDLKLDVPFKAISIDFFSEFPNLLSYHSNIVYLVSKKSIRFFYFLTNYFENDWDEKRINNSVKWFTTEYKIADLDDVNKGVETMFSNLQGPIREEIEKKIKIEENDDLPF